MNTAPRVLCAECGVAVTGWYFVNGKNYCEGCQYKQVAFQAVFALPRQAQEELLKELRIRWGHNGYDV